MTESSFKPLPFIKLMRSSFTLHLLKQFLKSFAQNGVCMEFVFLFLLVWINFYIFSLSSACYGIVQVPTGPWFCRKCESQERAARVVSHMISCLSWWTRKLVAQQVCRPNGPSWLSTCHCLCKAADVLRYISFCVSLSNLSSCLMASK